MIREKELYCARSNFPEFPPLSALEIWNTATADMSHSGSHSFGITDGWLTWVDWHDDAWWCLFANYSAKVKENPSARGTGWTTLVRFDDQWRRTGGWVFPQELVERFEPQSCGGGTWGPNGRLYCTGAERGEVYELELPTAGSTLFWRATLTAPITGGGIAWDPADDHVFYGIDRDRAEVVVLRTPDQSGSPVESGVEEPN
jgi:hypothetical protein